MDGQAPYRVLGDQPYAGDDDPLEFGEVARRLTRVILDSRASTPFAIGIEASWGRGKSTLMQRLERELKRGVDGVEVRTVSYNAWTAEGEDVLAGLVKSVLQAMDPNALRRALWNKNLISWARLLVSIVLGVFGLGTVADQAWKRLSVDASTRNQVNDLVRQAMERWASKVPSVGANRLLVVFIDDLDRCSSENVLRVFEGLKLYLDARGFVFVIGYDEGVIAQAVVERNQAGGHATGRDYVEKIVQIVFRIPEPTEAEVGALLAGLLAESRTAALFDEPAQRLVIERNGRNPRRMKRFVNRFVIDNELDETSRDMEPELLVKLLLIETYYPEFARFFASADRVNPIEEFLGYEAAREALRRGIDDDSRAWVESVFAFYGLSLNATTGDPLDALEQEVPEAFSKLVRDPEFRSLVDGLRDQAQQEQILEKVGRRSLRTAGAGPAMAAAVEADASLDWTAFDLAIAGKRVVWVDDNPESVTATVEFLRSHGAEVKVALAVDYSLGDDLLRADLLISDVARGDRSEAGFDDLEVLRGEHTYSGPAIFFTARVTPKSRTRATALGASMATTEAELVRAIAAALGPPEAQQTVA